MAARTKEIIYHYTCEFHLASIEKSGYLTLTEHSISLSEKPMPPVLWLTTSPTPENNGLKFDNSIPDFFDKTRVRITLRKHPFMQRWVEWHDRTGRSAEEKEVLIASAGAEESHKDWYISLIPIPLGEILIIENLKTGKVYYEKQKKKTDK